MIFRRKKSFEEQRGYTLQDASFAEALGFTLDGMSAEAAREATYFACMRIMTDNMSKLPLKVYKDTGDGIEEQSNHYLKNVLALRPNPYMSASDFWKAVEYARNDSGHSIVFMETRGGFVTGLYPLPMGQTQIWIDDRGLLGSRNAVWYVYHDGNKEYKLSPDEVLHFKGMTADGITGMSVKDYLRTVIQNSQSGAEYVNKYFKGGLSAKGVLQYTADIEEANVNRLKARFEKMATGMDNVGKILPVPLGFSFSTINSTMADSQFLELNHLSIRQIAAAFGVKMHQINDMTQTKYANITEQMDEFYRDTLLAILTMYEQELTYKLLREDEVEAGVFLRFNVDAMLRMTLKERYEAYAIGIEKGFLEANEARRKENMPARKGGDQLIVNGTMQPLDKVGMSYEQPATATPLKGGEKTNDSTENGDESVNE
jgi:HK97 family phage portal protein